MRRALAISALLWAVIVMLVLATVPASAQIDPAARGLAIQAKTAAVPTTYVGQVATRSLVNNYINASYKQANAISLHIARERMTAAPCMISGNWYSDTSVHEAGSGGTATYTLQVQYPIGSAWQRVTYGGAVTSPTVADGDNSPCNDAVALATPIPAGAAFLVFRHIEASAAMVFRYYGAFDHRTPNDRMQLAASGLAESTTIASPNGNAFATPVAIVARTNRPAVCLYGDSRVFGYGAASNGAGDTGELAPTLGPQFAYISLGIPSETVKGFLSGYARRVALSAYCSHVIANGSINDLQSSPQSTSAQLLADIGSMAALFPSKPVFWSTIVASATSTDSWVTIANQTPNSASNANRLVVNRGLRSGLVAGLAGVFDNAAVLESSLDSGKLAIGNGGQAVTVDGLHLNDIGYQMIRNARPVDPGRITRLPLPTP